MSKTLTQEEKRQVSVAALRVLDEIAADFLILMEECEGRSYLMQDEVIEAVIDADRMVSLGGLSVEVNEKVYAMKEKDQMALFRTIFPAKRYS